MRSKLLGIAAAVTVAVLYPRTSAPPHCGASGAGRVCLRRRRKRHRTVSSLIGRRKGRLQMA